MSMNDHGEKSGTPLPSVPREHPKDLTQYRVGQGAGESAKDVLDWRVSPLIMKELTAALQGFGVQKTPKAPLIRRVASALQFFNCGSLDVTEDTITVKGNSGVLLRSVHGGLEWEKVATGPPREKSHSSCGDRFSESWWEPLLLDGTPVGRLEISGGDKGYICKITLDRGHE
ncbi:MAG: hypothetical protein ABSG32_25455 [Terriglobia bacterium]